MFTYRLAWFKPSSRNCCERHGMSWVSGWEGDRGQPGDSSTEEAGTESQQEAASTQG